MSVSRVAGIVSASWLRKQLAGGPSKIKVLDASWTLLKGGKEDYLSKHIPTAAFFDMNKCVEPRPTLPRNMPDPDCFQDYVQSLGVNNDSHLIVYDRGAMMSAARTWWTFRAFGHNDISVLDGGFNKWLANQYETAEGEEQIKEKGNFKVNINKELIKSFEDMVELAKEKAKSSQIIDARKPEHYFGKEEEPTSSTVKALEGMNQPMPKVMQRGHVPGAKNMIDDVLVNEDKCLLHRQELKQLFATYGVDLKKPLTTMCYNGNAASLLALAAYICGKDDTSVYFGSWTEYGQRATPDLVATSGGEKVHGG